MYESLHIKKDDKHVGYNAKSISINAEALSYRLQHGNRIYNWFNASTVPEDRASKRFDQNYQSTFLSIPKHFSL